MHADTLWQDAADIAARCLHHPFLTGIADGTLDRAAFEHYVGQDAFFLDAFARAYALGLAKAPDRETMGTFKVLLDGGMEELRLHAGYAARWGVDLHPSPTTATRAYTDFLLRVAALEPAGHLCAAMTPCMRLYAWLGQQLAPITDPQSPYAEWVHTYAAQEFDDLATTMERLLDDLGGDAATIAEHYHTAMELELAFFDSAHRHPTPGDAPHPRRRTPPMSTPPVSTPPKSTPPMSTTDALRRDHPDRWRAATRSPFLDAAGDGTLDPAVFDRWLEQDHHFVQTLIRAWGLMLQSAPRSDLSLLISGMDAFAAEVTWFEDIAAARDGGAGTLHLGGPLLPATVAYDEALLHLAARPYPEAITAMWAVEAAYLSAWQHVAPGHPRYTEYITHWANDAFAAFVTDLAAVVDRELPDGPTAAATQAFLTIADHEAAFWAMTLQAAPADD